MTKKGDSQTKEHINKRVKTRIKNNNYKGQGMGRKVWNKKLKGYTNSGSFEKGNTPWNKGIRKVFDFEEIRRLHWEEGKSIMDISKKLGVSDKLIRLRLKENNIPIRNDKKECAKLVKHKLEKTQFKKGHKPSWTGTKGIRKKTKASFKKGDTPWNKGLIGVQESIKKGKTFEEFYGNKKAKDIKGKIKEKRKYQITPVKDTKIEIKIQNFLKQLGIEFFTHQYINIKHGFQCDIFIPSRNLVIECDGDYWHQYPTGRDIDHVRTKELLQRGFKVLRLWEFDINDMNLNDFKKRLI